MLLFKYSLKFLSCLMVEKNEFSFVFFYLRFYDEGVIDR